MTFPDRLDAAADGEEFAGVLQSLFHSLELSRDDEWDEEDYPR